MNQNKFSLEINIVKLSDIVNTFNGEYLDKKQIKDYGTYPVYGANGLVGYTNKYKFNKKLITIGRVGSIGSINVIKGKCWITDNTIIINPNDNVNFEYILYLLKSIDFNKYRSGTTQPLIKKTDILNIRFKLPPLETQRKIVEVLEKAEKALEKRREANNLLDEYLKSVFIEMFGDPVRNEKGWKIKELGEISLHISSGATPKGGQSVYLEEGIPFIRSQNVLMNQLNFKDIVFIDRETHEKMKRSKVKYNDVLLNITGASIGRVSVYKGEDNSANVNQHVCIIRLKNEVLPMYLSYFISMDSFQNIIKKLNAGATREALNYEQIKKFKILVPTIELQQSFSNIVDKVTLLKEKNNQTTNNLQSLFNSLMQDAFSGRLFI